MLALVRCYPLEKRGWAYGRAYGRGRCTIRVVVLTADADEGTVLRYVLDQNGYTTSVAEDLAEAPPAASADLVVLDLASFGPAAFAACRQLAAQRVPVLALVGGDKGAIAAALDLGAEDGLLKPFSYAELLARVRAIARRTMHPSGIAVLRVGELELCPARFEARYRGHLMRLSRTEFRILHLLAARAGRVVSADEIVRDVWGYDESNPGLVRINIYRLRQKLETDPRQPRLLRSVPGPGFMLDPPRAAG